ncbi:hypothetical protein A2881_05915 [Candidatus Peribacteria bacterium RIFCSPHIGHO2_01_FULL_55_13]|nr:MAG: hypothetical protein A2881_05915 [Candidatus Peribacteria bacterium RIFCSPHIGHO2_01_FULL_55_13]
MLTFTSPDGRSLLIETGNKTKLAFYPSKPVAGALNFLSKPEEEPAKDTISWPGEYDIGGVSIRGIGQNDGGHVSFVIEAEGVRIAILSAPLQEWSDHDLGLLGDVAVMAIQGDDPKIAQKVIEEVDPRVIIALASDKSSANDVLKVIGAVGMAPVPEWKLKGGLPAEGRQVIVLEA